MYNLAVVSRTWQGRLINLVGCKLYKSKDLIVFITVNLIKGNELFLVE